MLEPRLIDIDATGGDLSAAQVATWIAGITPLPMPMIVRTWLDITEHCDMWDDHFGDQAL